MKTNKMFKKIIKRYFSTLVYFFGFLRYKIITNSSVSFLVAVLDGLGLTMFIPLLELANKKSGVQANVDDKDFSFIVRGLTLLHIPISVSSVLILIVIFFALKGIVRFLSERYFAIMQQSFLNKIRLSIIQDIDRVSYKYFVTTDAGQILNTAASEIHRLGVAYWHYFKGLEQGVLVLVYMAFAFALDAKFSVLVVTGGALSNFLYQKIYKRTKSESAALTKNSNIFYGLLNQYVHNFKYLKATNVLEKFYRKIEETTYSIAEKYRRMGILNGLVLSVREPIMITIVAIVIVIQLNFLGGELGAILVSLLFFYRALGAIVAFQNAYNNFLSVSGSIENARNFQRDLRQNREQKGIEQIERVTDSLELKNVSFGYDSTPVVSKINLKISKNESIAFVGESGSGKTTLANILAGLLPIDQGEFLIDGRNLKNIDTASYQKRIGYITQDPVIFTDTIFNNITIWDKPDDQGFARYQKVLKQSAIDSFVSTLKQGNDTLLGNNGINLSGGQKQRISIARELYKDIDILIMDEATSALDGETEKAIQKNIESLKGKYTMLVIAHRLSTIKNVDKIIVMDHGRIVQMGTYNELANTEGHFKRMTEFQNL